jgi:hypothetical protein
MAQKVQIAKKDLFAEIDDGSGHRVRRLIARRGQEVPPAFADLVDDSDVSKDTAKTRSLLGRSTPERIAGLEVEEPDHAAARAAAGIREPEAEADLQPAPAADTELLAENEQLRKELETAAAAAEKRLAEVEEEANQKVAEAEAHAEATLKEAEATGRSKEPPTKPKAKDGAKNKARKTAPNKARQGAKRK